MTPEVRDALQEKYGLVGLKTTIASPLDMERVRQGWPTHGPGSRGGRTGLRKALSFRYGGPVARLPSSDDDEEADDADREIGPSEHSSVRDMPVAGESTESTDMAMSHETPADESAAPLPVASTSRRNEGLGETAPREAVFRRKAVHRALHGAIEGEITEPTLVVSGLPGQAKKGGKRVQGSQRAPGSEDVEMSTNAVSPAETQEQPP